MILAWPILVGVALLGWGLAAAALARRWSRVDLRNPADALPLGVAVYLTIAGVALALDLHTRWFTTVMVLLGLGAATVALVVWARVASVRWWGDVSLASALVCLVLAYAVWRAGHVIWNACDDDVAYLYLARRLTETGDLMDPLNNRRVTSLGGMSSLQAIFLVRLGDAALLVADLFLGPLLVMVQLWRTAAGRWSISGIAVAITITVFTGNLGIVNSSPVLIPIGLALATYRFAVRMRASGDRAGGEVDGPRAGLVLGVALGLMVAAAGTLRPQFALALAPFAIAAALLPPIRRSSLLQLAGLAVGGALGLVGWAVASWRAVGTPLFPIMGGNVDPAWPATGPERPGPTVGDLVANVVDVMTSPEVGLALLLGAVALLGAHKTKTGGDPRAVRWAGPVYALAAGSTVLLLAALGLVWWNLGALSAFPRFWMPLVVATVAFPMAVLNAGSFTGARAAVLKGGAFTASAVVVTLGAAPYVDLAPFVPDITSGRAVDALAADRYAGVEADYDEVSAMIEPDSKVLTTVDVPSLLLGHDFDVHTLDLIGSTSPQPRLPYFEGAEATLSWARDHGYDYIVATEPAASACLYNVYLQENNLATGGVYGSWAPWYLDWFQFLAEITAEHPPSGVTATRVGSLIIAEV